MIDAWEIVGRLVTDAAFETAVFAINYATPYAVNLSNRAQIPKPDFDALRAVVATRLTGPISLMALGEILVAMRAPNFKATLDQLAAAIANTGVNTGGRTPMFYTALGATMVDSKLRAVIAGNFPAYGFKLDGDAPDAAKIITDAGVGPKADAFCASCWSKGCNLKTVFWDAHIHPVETLVDNPFVLKL